MLRPVSALFPRDETAAECFGLPLAVELRPFAAGIDADAPDDSAASSVDSDAALLLRCDRCAAYGYAGIDAPLGAAGSAGAAGAPAPCASALWTCAVCGAAHADDGTSPASSSARLNSARAAPARGAGGRREHAARWGVSGGDSSASWTGSWIDVPLHEASELVRRGAHAGEAVVCVCAVVTRDCDGACTEPLHAITAGACRSCERAADARAFCTLVHGDRVAFFDTNTPAQAVGWVPAAAVARRAVSAAEFLVPATAWAGDLSLEALLTSFKPVGESDGGQAGRVPAAGVAGKLHAASDVLSDVARRVCGVVAPSRDQARAVDAQAGESLLALVQLMHRMRFASSALCIVALPCRHRGSGSLPSALPDAWFARFREALQRAACVPALVCASPAQRWRTAVLATGGMCVPLSGADGDVAACVDGDVVGQQLETRLRCARVRDVCVRVRASHNIVASPLLLHASGHRLYSDMVWSAAGWTGWSVMYALGLPHSYSVLSSESAVRERTVCVQAAVAYTRAARRRLRVITAFLNTEAVVALMLKQASAPVVLKCCMLQALEMMSVVRSAAAARHRIKQWLVRALQRITQSAMSRDAIVLTSSWTSFSCAVSELPALSELMRLVYRWMLTLNDAPSRWPCIADELQWAGSERYAAFVWPQVLLVPSGVGAGAVQVEDVVRLRASPPDAWLDDHRAVVLDAGDHVLVVGAARDIASTWPDAACFPVAARATDVALVAAALDKPELATDFHHFASDVTSEIGSRLLH